jgi:catechol 2,3-dioxygenase-like lactoylglutathione lyase family enzyme
LCECLAMTATAQDESANPPGPKPVGRLASVSLDCTDPAALAAFYGDLLGLSIVYRSPDGGVIALSDGTVWLTMMRAVDHVAPTWPEPGQLQQMHLDIAVTDLEHAVGQAVALGAVPAGHQPSPDSWRVLLDPAGHPFCLTTVDPE